MKDPEMTNTRIHNYLETLFMGSKYSDYKKIKQVFITRQLTLTLCGKVQM